LKKRKRLIPNEKRQFYGEVSEALSKQTKFSNDLRQELSEVKYHGGLGWAFITFLKAFALFLVFVVVAVGVYIVVKLPHLKNFYSVSVIFVGLTVSILWWRRIADDYLV